ncbi:hypothetical protein [Pseudohalioglobus lutimaris]|nr:hypothetical protein [Pseudohalioglobus lutimaris]
MFRTLLAICLWFSGPSPDRDRAIAEIARSLFDYFYVGRMAKQ